MDQFLRVLWLAALPAGGNFIGALAAEFLHLTPRRLSLALHASAGVLLAVVAVEIMPESLRQAPPWVVIVSFIAGGAAFIGLDHFLENLRARAGKEARGSGPWTIYASVAIDLISDGVMIGVAVLLSARLALVLALGQGLADVPQGLATMVLFQKSAPRATRILLTALLTLPLYVGAVLGYFVVGGGPQWLRFGVLGFTAGLLTTLAVEEIVPQAHERSESHAAAAIFVCSFAGFIALTAYL